MGRVTAQPIEEDDPLDPERILNDLPEHERGNFLDAYRAALAGARDPAGWKNLRRTLRLWSFMAIATNRPGHYQARERARAGTGEGMLLEDAVKRFRPT